VARAGPPLSATHASESELAVLSEEGSVSEGTRAGCGVGGGTCRSAPRGFVDAHGVDGELRRRFRTVIDPASPVGDCDHVDGAGRVEVPVPDAHRLLPDDIERRDSYLVLRLLREHVDRHARCTPGLVADLREEVPSHPLRGRRRGFSLDPAVVLPDVPERHYSPVILV
jgi:hypothetical protein